MCACIWSYEDSLCLQALLKVHHFLQSADSLLSSTIHGAFREGLMCLVHLEAAAMFFVIFFFFYKIKPWWDLEVAASKIKKLWIRYIVMPFFCQEWIFPDLS